MSIPIKIQINKVCNKINNPIEIGWLIKNIKIDKKITIKDINIFMISKNSLIKIIILEIIDKEILFLWSF